LVSAAEALQTPRPRCDEMGHAADGLLKLGRAASFRRHRGEHRQGLRVAIAFILVPRTESVCEGLHRNLRSLPSGAGRRWAQSTRTHFRMALQVRAPTVARNGVPVHTPCHPVRLSRFQRKDLLTGWNGSLWFRPTIAPIRRGWKPAQGILRAG